MVVMVAARCSRNADSTDEFTHHPATPMMRAAATGHAHSWRRRKRVVASRATDEVRRVKKRRDGRPSCGAKLVRLGEGVSGVIGGPALGAGAHVILARERPACRYFKSHGASIMFTMYRAALRTAASSPTDIDSPFCVR